MQKGQGLILGPGAAPSALFIDGSRPGGFPTRTRMEHIIPFITNHPMLFAALAGIIGLIIWTELQAFTRGYQTISPQQAVQLINREDALVLDVREDRELTQGKIAGARHIPIGVLKNRLDELRKNQDRPIITYCRTGQRSGQASNLLHKQGFAKVYNLAGGLLAWEGANLPTIKR